MIKVGDIVKWLYPLDEDYSYGTVLELQGNTAKIQGSGYYKNKIYTVHLRHLIKLEKGGITGGRNKRSNK